ncbi:hypothetical protein A2U01_0076670, partial [Trifolium medium]|nr:hypothetical protein [Trifolium medium]
ISGETFPWDIEGIHGEKRAMKEQGR